MQMANYEVYGGTALLCGVVSARWALELNYSQGRQLVCFLGGCFFGPLMPFIISSVWLEAQDENQLGEFGAYFQSSPLPGKHTTGKTGKQGTGNRGQTKRFGGFFVRKPTAVQ